MKTKEMMQTLGHGIEAVLTKLTGGKAIYTLLVWEQPVTGSVQVNYVSNGVREQIKDGIQALLDRWDGKEHEIIHGDWLDQYLVASIADMQAAPADAITEDMKIGFIVALEEVQRVANERKVATEKFDYKDYLRGGKHARKDK